MPSIKIFFFGIFLSITIPGISQQNNPKNQSSFHQFDFWLGEWEVYKFGTDTLAGISHIQTIIDSVGLLENYSTANGKYKGKSLNKYNPANNKWEQYWIDNSGLTLYLKGGFEKGKMVLDDKASGSPNTNRITWEPLPNERVRQSWDVSADGGKSWSRVFDGEYRRVGSR